MPQTYDITDRMLVRAHWTSEEKIGIFSEGRHRAAKNIRYIDWGEYIVAWRRDKIEFYNEHVSVSF